MDTILIRYNELGLKSPRVRRRFQNQMIRNIEDKFILAGLDCIIESDWGRIYLQTDNENHGIRILKTVFGIISVSPVIISSDKINTITEKVIDYSSSFLHENQSFALRTRRTGNHDYTSMELAEYVGREILNNNKNKNLTVNLTSPDVEIFIEVRKKNSYIFSHVVAGPGGLPLGTQGKIICVFTDDNSYIASWLLMKRGCRVYPVYFTDEEKTSSDQEAMYISQVEYLKPWSPNLKLKYFQNISQHGKSYGNLDLENKEFRNFCNRFRIRGICLSYNIKGFQSNPSNLKSDLPIFYPLIGLNTTQIKEIENKILDV